MKRKNALEISAKDSEIEQAKHKMDGMAESFSAMLKVLFSHSTTFCACTWLGLISRWQPHICLRSCASDAVCVLRVCVGFSAVDAGPDVGQDRDDQRLGYRGAEGAHRPQLRGPQHWPVKVQLALCRAWLDIQNAHCSGLASQHSAALRRRPGAA